MAGVNYKTGLDFEIYVDSLFEALKPSTLEEVAKISKDLHEHIENSVYDYIDSQDMDYDDYESPIELY